jgi:hypothetical protein
MRPIAARYRKLPDGSLHFAEGLTAVPIGGGVYELRIAASWLDVAGRPYADRPRRHHARGARAAAWYAADVLAGQETGLAARTKRTNRSARSAGMG